MSTIKTVKRGNNTYYQLWDKGKFVKHIGNAKAYGKYLSDLEKLERKKQALTQRTPTPDMPTSKYDVIYADPPWEYDFSETDSRAIENQYPTMPVGKIKKLQIPTQEDAVLFLWATAPKLREALEVMETWGFTYRTNAVWDKEKIGMGYWFRGQHELLLVGVKGKFSPPDAKIRFSSIIRKVRTKHSVKPDCIYSMIETMFPNGKYLELFARKQRPRWENWGLDINYEQENKD